MASTAAHTAAAAGFAHKQQQPRRRPLSRIVPAIPHRLARAPAPVARPITPDQANKNAAPQPTPQPEPQAGEGKQADAQQAAAATVEAPLTPDSKIDGMEKDEPSALAPAQSPPPPQSEEKVTGAGEQDAGTNGHTTDAIEESSAVHADPAPAVNGTRRKLTIPAQLPPPFYPSSKPDTPTPSVENNNGSKIPVHKHQLSGGAVVFKSANGSPATPATPQEFDQDARYHSHSAPHPPPGLAPSQHAEFLPPQFQHPSEVVAPWVHPPYSMAPAEQIYENGAGFGSPQYPNGMASQPEPFENHYTSGETNLHTNGAIASHSQSPSKAQFGGPQPSSDYGEDHRAMQYQNGNAHPTEHVEQSPFELAAYLFTQFGNPEFADFVLQIRSPESALFSIPVHGIVVVRSPVIAEAVRRSPVPTHRSRDARRLIDVMAIDPHVTRDSLEEAVKVLYGAPLLQPQSFLYGLGPYAYEAGAASSSNEARRRMQQVISYIAAAKALQIPSMQARGVEIARLLLRWDTVDQVLRYGLQASSARKDIETEDFFIATLLNYVIEFIAYTFPVDFKPYTIAPEFQDAPRLPILLETRPPTHNPRLSKIRFGDAPPEDDHSPSHVNRILSTILFSLPPPLLDRLFNHRAIANQIGWTGATKLLSDVVSERENRRQKALRSQLKPAQDGTVPAALLDNMYTEEQVEQFPAHPSGYRLATKRSAAES